MRSQGEVRFDKSKKIIKFNLDLWVVVSVHLVDLLTSSRGGHIKSVAEIYIRDHQGSFVRKNFRALSREDRSVLHRFPDRYCKGGGPKLTENHPFWSIHTDRTTPYLQNALSDCPTHHLRPKLTTSPRPLFFPPPLQAPWALQPELHRQPLVGPA